VLVILMEQRGHPDQLDVAVGTLMSHLHCYMLALAAERVSRNTEIWVEPPTLANIFDAEREVRARAPLRRGCLTVSPPRALAVARRSGCVGGSGRLDGWDPGGGLPSGRWEGPSTSGTRCARTPPSRGGQHSGRRGDRRLTGRTLRKLAVA
jgi:hypothetical protein